MTAGLPFIKEIKKYLGNSYTFIHFNHRDRNRDILDRDTRLLINISPLEWYNVYNQCTLNFSHYFHGTIVGIRNNVPTLSFDKTNLIFELSVNSENRLIRKAAGKIIKLLSSQLGNMLPEGIVMQQHYIYVDISEQFAETGLRPKIVQAHFEDKIFHLEFKV